MKDTPEDMYRHRIIITCPHCGEPTDELISVPGSFTGCEDCTEYCDACNALVFKDEMHEAYVFEPYDILGRKRWRGWQKGKVCQSCWDLYEDDPCGYEDISSEDPYKILWESLMPKDF